MKKILCDKCGSDQAKTFKYLEQKIGVNIYKDFCVNCLQSFVLENQVKLIEVTGLSEYNKRIIHG